MSAETRTSSGIDLVAFAKTLYALADCVDFPRKLSSKDRPLWSPETKDEAHYLAAATQFAVCGRDSRRMDSHENLVVLRGWRLDIFDLQNIRWPVRRVHN